MQKENYVLMPSEKVDEFNSTLDDMKRDLWILDKFFDEIVDLEGEAWPFGIEHFLALELAVGNLKIHENDMRMYLTCCRANVGFFERVEESKQTTPENLK